MAVNLTEEDRALWRRRIQAGEHDQRKMHRLWFEVLAFCQGHQWVKYSGPLSRRLVTIEPPRHGQRYSVDELSQYRLVLAGEFGDDDERPAAQFIHDNAPDEDYAEQANLALSYAWEEEADATAILAEAVDTMVDLGTAPIRCRFDSDYGEPTPHDVPHVDGVPTDVHTALAAMDNGQQIELKPTKPGKICWEAGTPFNILVPPGVPRERDFKWLVWKSIGYLPDLKEQYPGVTLQADAVAALATLSKPADDLAQAQDPSVVPTDNLGDHCFVYTCYQYPDRKYPRGRIVILGSEKQVPLETADSLGYRSPNGDWRPGVYFLHAIRLTDRFWSRGFMELALDPQRAINQHVTRIEQTIAKGQPVRWIEEGSAKKLPDGSAGSIGWLHPGKRIPVTDQGMAPGPWMKDAIVMQRENLARAVLPESSMGDNPEGVTTYSQLALLHAQARKRLAKIVKQKKQTVISLTEDTCWDIKTKWGPDRQLKLAGEDGQLAAQNFNASAWPDYYKIRFATGAGLPRTQEAQLKLIEDTWAAAVESQAAIQNPDAWLTWRKQSMEAGKVLDLPTPPVDAQREKAQYENKMIYAHPDPQFAIGLVAYFDTAPIHLPEHRAMQGQAMLDGNNALFIALEAHCKEHERQVLLTTQQQIGTPGPQVPVPGGLPPNVPPPPQQIPVGSIAAGAPQDASNGSNPQGQ